ncbi:MAG: 50S ribosomal protein L10 [Anaerolineae bacterium]|nr:50S ribosomal protein L10 [Anaerolineae bacterium]
MAITKERKNELVEHYRTLMGQSQGMLFVDYRGLRVNQMEKLRGAIRESGSSIYVVKNRLMKLILEEAGMTTPSIWLDDPTAIAFCFKDVPPVAKVMTDFTKDSTLTIKGGIVQKSVLSADQVRALADLPSREVLLGQVLGTINAPASQVVGVVAGGIRQVLNVLQAYVDKLEEGGASATQTA